MSKSTSSQPIIIVGAGAGGMAGALAAATQGANVVLLEKSERLGGTVTHTLIHTLGGLFDDQGEFINPGLPVELSERLHQASPHTRKRRIGKTWTLSVDPAVYAQVVNDWLNEYDAIERYPHSAITALNVSGGCIDRITFTHNGNQHTFKPHALIDATGHAEVVRYLDSDLVSEGAALAGLILQLRGVTHGALQFPKGVALLQRIRKAAANHDLPAECATLWLDNGVYPDEVYVKFNLAQADYDTVQMAHVAEELLAWLHALPAFSQAHISAYGQLGIRDGGRVQGDYCLTETDIKQGCRFTDAVCRACWPIEHWHPQQGITLDYLPPGHSYEIPLRALKVRGLDNLFVAGKCLSAEPRAQASARVVGTCWAMGEGVTKAILQKSFFRSLNHAR